MGHPWRSVLPCGRFLCLLETSLSFRSLLFLVLCLCVHACENTCMHTHMRVFVDTCMCTYRRVCACVCTCVCACVKRQEERGSWGGDGRPRAFLSPSSGPRLRSPASCVASLEAAVGRLSHQPVRSPSPVPTSSAVSLVHSSGNGAASRPSLGRPRLSRAHTVPPPCHVQARAPYMHHCACHLPALTLRLLQEACALQPGPHPPACPAAAPSLWDPSGPEMRHPDTGTDTDMGWSVPRPDTHHLLS